MALANAFARADKPTLLRLYPLRPAHLSTQNGIKEARPSTLNRHLRPLGLPLVGTNIHCAFSTSTGIRRVLPYGAASCLQSPILPLNGHWRCGPSPFSNRLHTTSTRNDEVLSDQKDEGYKFIRMPRDQALYLSALISEDSKDAQNQEVRGQWATIREFENLFANDLVTVKEYRDYLSALKRTLDSSTNLHGGVASENPFAVISRQEEMLKAEPTHAVIQYRAAVKKIVSNPEMSKRQLRKYANAVFKGYEAECKRETVTFWDKDDRRVALEVLKRREKELDKFNWKRFLGINILINLIINAF